MSVESVTSAAGTTSLSSAPWRLLAVLDASSSRRNSDEAFTYNQPETDTVQINVKVMIMRRGIVPEGCAGVAGGDPKISG